MLILISSINSCITYKGNYTTNTIIKPVNIDKKKGKWLVDEPILIQIDRSFSDKVLYFYKTYASNKFNSLRTIREFNNLNSFKYALENNSKTLDLYQEKTHYDYLISTKIDLKKVDNNMFTKELFIKITVHSLNSRDKILEKEYIFKDDFTGFNDNPFASNLTKFLNVSVRDCIKNFSKNENWKSVNK